MHVDDWILVVSHAVRAFGGLVRCKLLGGGVLSSNYGVQDFGMAIMIEGMDSAVGASLRVV
eukprot:1105291-Prymnesium_polylepis.1